MAEWESVISRSPLTGVTSTLAKEDGKYYLSHQADNSALLSENRDLNRQPQNKRAQTRMAARVPAQLWYVIWPSEFKAKHGENPHRPTAKNRKGVRDLWRAFVREKLNDKANAYLRVDGGKRL